MKAMNPVIPKGMPLAGVYGALANGWGVTAPDPEGFAPTPGNTPDEPEVLEVQTEVQEVTDDGRPDAPGDEVPVSGE